MAYDSRRDTVVVVHGRAVVSGTLTDFLFCSGVGMTTGPADTPPNKPILGVLVSGGAFEQDLFGGNDFAGLVRPGGTTIGLQNLRGALDPFVSEYDCSGYLWNVYIGNRGDAFPSGYLELYRSYCLTVQAPDPHTLQVVLRDRSDQLDRPVAPSVFAGTGGLEGTTVIPGNKQLVMGSPGFIPVRLIDVEKQIYWVCDGAVGNYSDLRLTYPSSGSIFDWDTFVGGVMLTRSANYTSAAQLQSQAPSADEVRFWFGEATDRPFVAYAGPVYMRLGTPPGYEVRVYASTVSPNTGSTWSYVDIVERAGLDVSESYSRSEHVSGLLVDDDRTYLQVLSDSARGDLAYYGFNRLDVFFSGKLREPLAEDTTIYRRTSSGVTSITRPLYTFTVDNTDQDSWTVGPVPGMPSPAFHFTMRAGTAWPCECDPTAPANVREYLTRDVWSVFGGINNDIKDSDRNAVSMSLSTADRWFLGPGAQANFVQRFLELHGGRRRILYLNTTRIDDDALAAEPGDNALIIRDRFGFDSPGVPAIVISKRIDSDRRMIRFGLWFGNAGPGGYLATSAGSPPRVDPSLTRNVVGPALVQAYGVVSVSSTGAGEIVVDDVVVTGESAVVYDPLLADVALLLQDGANTSTTLQDLSPTYGDSVTIAGGAAWTSSQQVDGTNMVAATQILPDIPGFTSTDADSRFSRASGQEISIEFAIRWNSVPNTDPSGVGFAWSGPSGNIVTLKLTTSSGSLALLNGSTNVGVISSLSADTTYKVLVRLHADDTMTIDLDGTEIYDDTCSSSNGSGTYTFIPFANGTANATAATWWGGPLRFTRNARARGAAFDLPFPTS